MFAVPICMTFVFVGVDMYQRPARCDHQPMGQWDRCEHYGRASVRLWPGTPTQVTAGGYDLDSQDNLQPVRRRCDDRAQSRELDYGSGMGSASVAQLACTTPPTRATTGHRHSRALISSGIWWPVKKRVRSTGSTRTLARCS